MFKRMISQIICDYTTQIYVFGIWVGTLLFQLGEVSSCVSLLLVDDYVANAFDDYVAMVM